MQARDRAVTTYIEEHREALVALLQDMIRTRSVNPAFDPASPGEAAMADLVRSRYAALEIPVELKEAVPGRPNVIATWAGGAGRPVLLVNCHLDTHSPYTGEWVDPYTGDVKTAWTVDPFGGEIRGGRIYGRGAVDHKAPIAATLLALEALRAHGIRLRGTVVCIHDADEETGGRYGMRYLAEQLPFDFDMALYACTSDFTPLGRRFFSAMRENNVIRALAGWHTYRIRVTGVNYHNMTPRRGLGAVEAMLALLERLRPLMERVNAAADPVEGTGQPAMRVSAIEPGPRAAAHHQSRSCEMIINRRISPGVDSKTALAEIQTVAAAHTRDHPENPATVTLERNLPAAVTPEDHPVVTGVCRAIRSVFGEAPTIAGMPAPVGISGFLAAHPIPTVLFGYGLVNLHHAIDEHIAIEDLVKTAKVYAVALMEWLGVDEDAA
jgi:succinyl-diaminopimelate desuccinylase